MFIVFDVPQANIIALTGERWQNVCVFVCVCTHVHALVYVCMCVWDWMIICMCIVKRGRRLIQSYRNTAWTGLDSTALRVSLALTPIGDRKRAHTHTCTHNMDIVTWGYEMWKAWEKPNCFYIYFLVHFIWRLGG